MANKQARVRQKMKPQKKVRKLSAGEKSLARVGIILFGRERWLS